MTGKIKLTPTSGGGSVTSSEDSVELCVAFLQSLERCPFLPHFQHFLPESVDAGPGAVFPLVSPLPFPCGFPLPCPAPVLCLALPTLPLPCFGSQDTVTCDTFSSWAVLGCLGGDLMASWAVLGPSWAYLGTLLGQFGAILGCFRPSWPKRGSFTNGVKA